MLIFVIPVLSPKVARSWQRVSKLFERCLRATCGQTSTDFKAIVVCNQKPETEFNHPAIEYIYVDFPPPLSDDFVGKTLDRGRKTLTGLLRAVQFNPSHVMFVDADDCVSKHLAAFVSQHSHHPGWSMKNSYVYKEGARVIYRKQKEFNHVCGSCNIIRTDLYDLTDPINGDADFIFKYYGEHYYIVEATEAKGVTIDQLPFAGTTYIVENGENYFNDNFDRLIVPNHIIDQLKSLRHYKIVTHAVRDEFGLYNIDFSSVEGGDV